MHSLSTLNVIKWWVDVWKFAQNKSFIDEIAMDFVVTCWVGQRHHKVEKKKWNVFVLSWRSVSDIHPQSLFRWSIKVNASISFCIECSYLYATGKTCDRFCCNILEISISLSTRECTGELNNSKPALSFITCLALFRLYLSRLKYRTWKNISVTLLSKIDENMSELKNISCTRK